MVFFIKSDDSHLNSRDYFPIFRLGEYTPTILTIGTLGTKPGLGLILFLHLFSVWTKTPELFLSFQTSKMTRKRIFFVSKVKNNYGVIVFSYFLRFKVSDNRRNQRNVEANVTVHISTLDSYDVIKPAVPIMITSHTAEQLIRTDPVRKMMVLRSVSH